MLKLRFIVFISFATIFSVNADDGNYYDNLDPADKIWVDSLVEKLTFSEKLYQLFWFHESAGREVGFYTGGKVSSIPMVRTEEVGNSLTYRVFDITNGFDDADSTRLRFPNSITRKAANKSHCTQLNKIYSFDFWLDLPITATKPVYYGVSLEDDQAKLEPFYSPDSLFAGLLKFDQILWVSNTVQLDSLILKDNFKRKQIKSLRKKVKDVLSMKQALKNARAVHATQWEADWLLYEEWKWDIYARSITLVQDRSALPLNILDGRTFCTYTFQPTKFSTFNRIAGYYGPISRYEASRNYNDDLERLKDYDYVVIPVAVLNKKQIDFINKLNKRSQIIVVDFNPENVINELSSEVTHLMVWEMNEITQTIAPQSIF